MEVSGKILLPNSEMLDSVKDFLNEGKQVIIPTRGASMMPFIHTNRDSVMLERRSQLKAGDIALAQIGKSRRYVLHRVIEAGEDGRVTLKGDGNLRGTERCRREDVCGIAVRIIRPSGKEIDTESPRFVRRSARWRSLPLFVRRCFLAAYRRLLGIPKNVNKI